MRKSLFIMLIGLVASPMTFTSCGEKGTNGQDSTMVNVIDYTDSVAGVNIETKDVKVVE